MAVKRTGNNFLSFRKSPEIPGIFIHYCGLDPYLIDRKGSFQAQNEKERTDSKKNKDSF